MKARDVFGHLKLLLALGVVVALVLPAAALGDTLPTVSGEEAGEVGVTTVKLSGQVNPNGTSGDGNTTWRLQWSPAGTDHGAEGEENWNTAGEGTIEAPASEEASPVGVEAMTGFGGELQPGQEYEFRLQAENGAGQAETAAPYPNFTMDAAVTPVLAAEPASSISIVSAHLTGTVDPEGGNVNPIGPEAMPIHWELQYSTDGSSWNTAGSGDITEAEGTTPIAVEADATGLTAATEYQVRLHAYTNSPTFALFVEADSPGPNPTFETDPAVAPVLSLGPAEDVTSEGAHISGAIDPEGGNEDALAGLLPIAWELQLSSNGGSNWNTVGSGELTGAEAESEAPIDVEADATGLVPNSTYAYKLVVHYAGLQKETPEGELGTFETEALKPDIQRATLWNPTPTSIKLRAEVHPHNSALTECHFEYGTGGLLDQTAPCGLPGGNNFTAVAAEVSDLIPSTEYEFRLVVANSAGTTEGDTRSFTSLEEPAPESCPNETIRNAQHATHLPDCRAWEKVSPDDKGNGDIVGDGLTTVASREGDAVVFNSRTTFGDTIGTGAAGQSTYLARRGADGWTTHSITPTPNPEALQTFFASTAVQTFSDDLRRAVVHAYDLPAASDEWPGDWPPRRNIYLEDTATMDLDTVTLSQKDVPFSIQNFKVPVTWGISADALHISFVPDPRPPVTRFLPEAAAGVPNVYQWDKGVLSLAGILPDETVPAAGSDIVPPMYRNVMSADGSRLIFTVPSSSYGPSQLFQRIDGNHTVWISQPEHADEQQNESGASPADLQGVTPDGRTVFFTTAAGLIDQDTNGSTDLYRYTDSPDPAEDQGNLTMISADGDLGGGKVVGMSDDGERVYYQTQGASLFVWDHGDLHLVIAEVGIIGNIDERMGAMDSEPGLGRVSPDGRYLAFAVFFRSVVDFLENTTNRHREMYVYDLDNNTITCVSCPAGPATADALKIPEVTQGDPKVFNTGFRPNFLSADGKVFFSTPEALLPQDSNGVADVYSYDPVDGSLSLISSGRGGDPANFADASPSGDDVQIVTRQQLAESDDDELVDLYDVRVDGGFAEPPSVTAPPCADDSCQGSATASPVGPELSSRTASRGNVGTNHRCGKTKRLVRRHGKARCVKKHHRRRAGANRRAGK